jgi:hypothetical protein
MPDGAEPKQLACAALTLKRRGYVRNFPECPGRISHANDDVSKQTPGAGRANRWHDTCQPAVSTIGTGIHGRS